MNVEDMQQSAAVQTKIGAQASTRLATLPGDVVVLAASDRDTRERSVAIMCAAQIASASEDCFVFFPESLADNARLIRTSNRRSVHHFLQRDTVGIKGRKHARYTLGRDAAIPSTGFMNVIGDQADGARHYCCR